MKPNVLTGPIQTRSMRPVNLHSCTKGQILQYFENAYSLDEWLFTSLKDEETFCKAPDRLRLPLIFYYAHPAVVFVNKFLLAGLIKERVDEHFEALFETGVDEMSWDDTENYRMGGEFKWPSVEQARQYRQEVRELVRRIIKTTPLELPITFDTSWWAVLMGVEHERIHLETSSVLIRQLPVDLVEKPQEWKYAPLSTGTEVVANPMVPAGDIEVNIGKDDDSPLWGWDNEYGKRSIRVPEFEATKFLITNREFLQFVKAGAYEDRNLWSDEGWRWKTFREAKHPTFWVCSQKCKSGCGSSLANYTHCRAEDIDREFGLRLMFDVVPLPLDWPAEVNYLEAKAFCAWKGDAFRLPTEAEHHAMRGLSKFEPSKETLTNTNEPSLNIDFKYGSSTPVNMFAASKSGFCDTFGNVWEWIEDHFNGLPGGSTHYLYDDFSTPCYDGLHTMMTGGSWISTGDEATRYARFSFRRHFFQHLGFRLARTMKNSDPSPVVCVKNPVYISGHGLEDNQIDADKVNAVGLKPLLTETTSAGIKNDTEKILADLVRAQYSSEYMSPILDSLSYCDQLKSVSGEMSRALVVGCGPGRIPFELTKGFDQVIGCDLSGRCIDFAMQLAKEKSIRLVSNGLETNNNLDDKELDIILPDGVNSEKVTFKQLTWLPVELGQFDLIIFDGLERVQNKKAWLTGSPNILKDKNSVALVIGFADEVRPLLSSLLTPINRSNEKSSMQNGHVFATDQTISVWKRSW